MPPTRCRSSGRRARGPGPRFRGGPLRRRWTSSSGVCSWTRPTSDISVGSSGRPTCRAGGAHDRARSGAELAAKVASGDDDREPRGAAAREQGRRRRRHRGGHGRAVGRRRAGARAPVVLLERRRSLAQHTTGRSAAAWINGYGGPAIAPVRLASLRVVRPLRRGRRGPPAAGPARDARAGRTPGAVPDLDHYARARRPSLTPAAALELFPAMRPEAVHRAVL